MNRMQAEEQEMYTLPQDERPHSLVCNDCTSTWMTHSQESVTPNSVPKQSFRCVPVGVVHRVTWARSEVERYTKCPECKMNGFIALEHSQTKVLVDVVRLEEQSHQHYRESMSFVLLAVFVSTLSPTHWVCTNSH
ncbi:uncharacterized protein LOC144003001 isoform X2 [Festucalex cinctus]